MAKPMILPVLPKKILGKRFNVDAAVVRAMKVAREETEIHERMFARFTKTWSSHNKPRWNKRVRAVNANRFVSLLSTSSTPFVFVEAGTRVRWRRMSRSFKAKTRPRVIGSRQGAGSALGFKSSPYPGITARNIRREIVKRRRNPYLLKIGKALRIL